jgi:heme A synthase
VVAVISLSFEPGDGLAHLRDVQFEDDLDQYSAEQLSSARKAAESWRTGLAALAALVATASVVKGRDTISSLPPGAAVALGVLAGGSLLASLVGATVALRAAYGWPQVVAFTDPVQLRERRFQEAARIRRHLLVTIIATYVAVLLLAGAVAVSWYAPSDAPSPVRATTTSATYCGSLAGTDRTSFRLRGQGVDRSVAYADLVDLAVVPRC